MRRVVALVLASASIAGLQIPTKAQADQTFWCWCTMRAWNQDVYRTGRIFAFSWVFSDTTDSRCILEGSRFAKDATKRFNIVPGETSGVCLGNSSKEELMSYSKQRIADANQKMGFYYTEVLSTGYVGDGKPIRKAKRLDKAKPAKPQRIYCIDSNKQATTIFMPPNAGSAYAYCRSLGYVTVL